MRPRTPWEKQRQEKKAFWNALWLAPLSLMLTAFAVVGFLKLLEVSGLL